MTPEDTCEDQIFEALNYSEIIIADPDFNRVLKERQNFDPSGQYSRPYLTKLKINRERQTIIDIEA